VRATKRTTRTANPQTRKRGAVALAQRVLQLDAVAVDAFVDALLPGATFEFREDLSDIIVSEQRKDEATRSLHEVLETHSRRRSGSQ
jgi:hypothetical protein